MKIFRRCLAGAMIAVSSLSWATFEIEIGLEQRVFVHDTLHKEASRTAQNGRIGLTTQGRNGPMRWIVDAYVGYDNEDRNRNRGDIKRAVAAISSGNVEVLFGIDQVFWGVAESRHLVNIINQSDLAADPRGEIWLGQPLVGVRWQAQLADVEFYLLPKFRERRFAEPGERFNQLLVIDEGQTSYARGANGTPLDIAVRVSRSAGPLDFGVSYFDGVSREPLVTPLPNGVLAPVYENIEQYGVDAQLTLGQWLWKAELLQRTWHGDRYWAYVAGVEFTSFGFLRTSADVGWLLEFMKDDRNPLRTAPTIYQDDLFFGARIQFNNVDDSVFLAGVIWDQESGERLWRVEAEHRLGNNLSFSITANLPDRTDRRSILHSVRRDGYVALELTYHFALGAG